MTVTLTKHEGAYVLDIGDTENRFSPDWMTEVNDALDTVVAAPAPLVLAATGKFYSNGLDLDWLGQNADQFEAYVAKVQALLARLLILPVPTVAAINGHAFGAGAMLAMTLDWRIMREDRGFFCFPEVDIQIPFTPGMAALIQAKLTPRAANDSMTTGRRFPGPEALAASIVDGTAPEAELFERAIALVAPLDGKPADTLGTIKSTMYAAAFAALQGSSAR
ncbi:enoyl-CoA hydratase-related protein [Nocardioides sp. CCNWLW239]|uniref:enoyl-CoA hydratase-related protein n=1 Tax=Nocardioides sp. CCNWLW239 TaxID=3128902 RepID=UPI0030173EFF